MDICRICGALAHPDYRGHVIQERLSSGERQHFILFQHHGCTLHPQPSICFNLDGTVVITPPRTYKRSWKHITSIMFVPPHLQKYDRQTKWLFPQIYWWLKFKLRLTLGL